IADYRIYLTFASRFGGGGCSLIGCPCLFGYFFGFVWLCWVLGCGSRKIFSNKFCGNEKGFYLCSPKRKKGFSLPDVRREAAGFSKGWDDFTVFWICVRMLYGSRSVSGGVEVIERY